MTDKRTIDNTDRPGQPEPGEDEATQLPEVRESGRGEAPVDEAKRKERERQTGE